MTSDTTAIQYPTRTEVDQWVDSIWELADATACTIEVLGGQDVPVGVKTRHNERFRYVKFSPAGMAPFYGYWQAALSTPAPLLFHVPGYGSEMSMHPELVGAGFNVLHVSPLGYSTPTGVTEEKKRDGNWPVLPDSALSGGTKGYRHWLANCAMAAKWAMSQPEVIDDRVSFFGTSQGGGGALLLGSMYKGRGVRCVAADLPFLTDFRACGGQGAYGIFAEALNTAVNKTPVWRAVGLVDTISHAHRLDLPVLLTAGGDDEACPAFTVENLFARLPGTRSYTFLKGVGHRYTTQFIPLATAWFRLHA